MDQPTTASTANAAYTRDLITGARGLFSDFNIRLSLVVTSAVGLVVGLGLQFSDAGRWASWIYGAFTVPVLIALLVEIISHLRRGEIGLDIVAALSMSAALMTGQELAAVIVALMYSGGQYLESFAERRAGGEMTALLERVPQTAVRHRDGTLEELPLDEIAPGDRLLIRRGDAVPVDGTVANGSATLDQSALTGETLPVELKRSELALSGSTNVGEAFELIASRPAAESTYAGIVRLVEVAQRSKAPMSRLADQYSMMFLFLTILMAVAAWVWTGDPIRAVAVLVIATPCPLILAVPVAIVSGLSRAAKHGILVKGGKALEKMAQITALVLDKTGTLTHGRARLVSSHPTPGFSAEQVLALAASLDQASKHIIAQTLVSEARSRQLTLAVPSNVAEKPGEGIEGCVDGRQIIVGGPRFVSSRISGNAAASPPRAAPGTVAVLAAVDGKLAAEFVLADELRSGTETLLENIRELGVERIVLATGDRQEVAHAITAGLSIDAVRSDLTPDQKVMVVLSERKNGPVMMVGDGVNDAPALAAADVGVAMGSKGAAASAEAADVVILVDRLDRILPAIKIAHRSRVIALESVYAGIGLSVIGMIAALLGYITPVQGALLQEVIDVAVIVNALRALGGRERV